MTANGARPFVVDGPQIPPARASRLGTVSNFV